MRITWSQYYYLQKLVLKIFNQNTDDSYCIPNPNTKTVITKYTVQVNTKLQGCIIKINCEWEAEWKYFFFPITILRYYQIKIYGIITDPLRSTIIPAILYTS